MDELMKDNLVEDLLGEYSVNAKPFIKWAGGKTQILKQLRNHYPSELNAGVISLYREPFLGGGAVFFDIANYYPLKSARLTDINKELILTYRVVQKNVQNLIEILKGYTTRYEVLSPKQKKTFFYDLRKEYNEERPGINFKKYSEKWIRRAAQMIFLNKTCFNGLYRVNSRGEFNTPSGVYPNHHPRILDVENLTRVSKVLEIAEIFVADFRELGSEVKKGDFVYFDPPYRPLNTTSNFTSYDSSGFSDKHQIELASQYKEFDNKGAFVMLSNSDPKNCDPNDNFFDKLYSSFNIHRIKASRMVNSKGNRRGQINEILVTNY